MPRCASTSIQDWLSENVPDSYLGKQGTAFKSEAFVKLVRKDLLFQNDEDFYRAYKRNWFHATLGSGPTGRPWVLSDELLSTTGFASIGRFAVRRSTVIERLRYLSDGDLHLLLVLRRHEDFLLSMHARLVELGLPFDFETFVTTLRTTRTQFQEGLDFASLPKLMENARVTGSVWKLDHFLTHGAAWLGDKFGLDGDRTPSLPRANASPDRDSLAERLTANRLKGSVPKLASALPWPGNVTPEIRWTLSEKNSAWLKRYHRFHWDDLPPFQEIGRGPAPSA